MSDKIVWTYAVPDDDFTRAGEASSDVKKKLKALGVNPETIRRVSIAMYEGEINMVIHAGGGKATVTVSEECIEITLADNGPGIRDIEQAMQEGFSTATDTVRSLGFGAGMGLPNMKKYADEFYIESEVGKGTHIKMKSMIDTIEGYEISVKLSKPAPLQLDGEVIGNVTELFHQSSMIASKASIGS